MKSSRRPAAPVAALHPVRAPRPAGERSGKVVIVSTDYGPPWNEGEKNMARVLEEALVDRGWNALVCPNPWSDLAASPVHRPSVAKLASAVRYWISVGRRARAEHASVVHLLSSVSSVLGLKCAILRRSAGTPLLLHVTGLASPVRGYRRLLVADRIVVGGSYLRPYFPEAVDLPPMSPHVNRDLERERRTAARDGQGVARRILYLGAMEPERGVHVLIDALALLADDLRAGGASVTLAWNGHGTDEYRRAMVARIARLGIEDLVHWQGVVRDLGSLYRAHDLVVIPRAAEQRMGFPLRVIEALSYGRPLIVADVAEMPLVVDGCGLVFRRGDVSALAVTLRRMLHEPAVYAACARGTYARAAEYDSGRTVGRFISLYRELLPGADGEPPRRADVPAAGWPP